GRGGHLARGGDPPQRGGAARGAGGMRRPGAVDGAAGRAAPRSAAVAQGGHQAPQRSEPDRPGDGRPLPPRPGPFPGALPPAGDAMRSFERWSLRIGFILAGLTGGVYGWLRYIGWGEGG